MSVTVVRRRMPMQVRNEFYKDTQGCILVYDVTNRACFEALGGWLKEAQDNGAENMVRVRANLLGPAFSIAHKNVQFIGCAEVL